MKAKKSERKLARPGGFWARCAPKPCIVSVRDSSSKLARALAFLKRIAGWGRKHP